MRPRGRSNDRFPVAAGLHPAPRRADRRARWRARRSQGAISCARSWHFEEKGDVVDAERARADIERLSSLPCVSARLLVEGELDHLECDEQQPQHQQRHDERARDDGDATQVLRDVDVFGGRARGKKAVRLDLVMGALARRSRRALQLVGWPPRDGARRCPRRLSRRSRAGSPRAGAAAAAGLRVRSDRRPAPGRRWVRTGPRSRLLTARV